MKLKREQGGVKKEGISSGAVLGQMGVGNRGRSGCQVEATASWLGRVGAGEL